MIITKVLQYSEKRICDECGKDGYAWTIRTKADDEGNVINTIQLCGKCLTKLAKKITER